MGLKPNARAQVFAHPHIDTYKKCYCHLKNENYCLKADTKQSLWLDYMCLLFFLLVKFQKYQRSITMSIRSYFDFKLCGKELCIKKKFIDRIIKKTRLK